MSNKLVKARYEDFINLEKRYRAATQNQVIPTYAGVALALYNFFHEDNDTSHEDTIEIIQKIFDDSLFYINHANEHGYAIEDYLEDVTGITLKARK